MWLCVCTELDEGHDITALAWDGHVSNIGCETASKGRHIEAYCMGLRRSSSIHCLIILQKVWNAKVLAVLLDDRECRASLG